MKYQVLLSAPPLEVVRLGVNLITEPCNLPYTSKENYSFLDSSYFMPSSAAWIIVLSLVSFAQMYIERQILQQNFILMFYYDGQLKSLRSDIYSSVVEL